LFLIRIFSTSDSVINSPPKDLNEDDIDIEIDGKVSLTEKMGLLTTVDDARLKLEEIFKNNIEPNNP